MMKYVIPVTLSLGIIGPSSARAAEKTVTLAVQNMYCAACPHTVKSSLQSVPGVKAVYIGAELAQMFARMGVKVTVVCRSHLLPAAEPEISDALSGYFRDEGIALECGVTYKQARQTEAGAALVVTREARDTTLTAERILVATGRAPNVEGLGLREAKIAQAANGSIQVDDRMQTTRPGVYAAGDVTGSAQGRARCLGEGKADGANEGRFPRAHAAPAPNRLEGRPIALGHQQRHGKIAFELRGDQHVG